MRHMTEEQKILHALEDEPTLARRAVAKSIAGLAVVVGLLIAGLYADDRKQEAGDLAAVRRPATQAESAVAQHRREVFEARRAQHEQRAGASARLARRSDAP